MEKPLHRRHMVHPHGKQLKPHNYTRGEESRKACFVLIMIIFFMFLIAGIVLLVVFVGLKEDDGKGHEGEDFVH